MIHEGSSRTRADAKRDGHPEAGDQLCRLRQLLSGSSTFLPPSLGGGLDCPPLRPSNEHILIVRVPEARGMIQTTSAPFV